jgi:hypothetical protein
VLEAIASQNLWIWHWFFGLPGSLTDINRSHLFSKLANGEAPVCNYKVNDHDYTMGHYLADSIYPSWGIFVKTIPKTKTKKKLSLQRHKKLAEWISRELLVLCKLGLLLFVA